MSDTRRLVLVLGILTALGLSVGCEDPLFVDHEIRSPYDRYSLLRGRQRPAKEANAYGIEQPALRDRLRPLERP